MTEWGDGSAMQDVEHYQPRDVPQVMVSSTFIDLTEHRAAIIASIPQYDMHANVMDNDAAKPAGNVIDSSLQMVRESKGYICIIGFKYGQTPPMPRQQSRWALPHGTGIQRGFEASTPHSVVHHGR